MNPLETLQNIVQHARYGQGLTGEYAMQSALSYIESVATDAVKKQQALTDELADLRRFKAFAATVCDDIEHYYEESKV